MAKPSAGLGTLPGQRVASNAPADRSSEPLGATSSIAPCSPGWHLCWRTWLSSVRCCSSGADPTRRGRHRRRPSRSTSRSPSPRRRRSRRRPARLRPGRAPGRAHPPRPPPVRRRRPPTRPRAPTTCRRAGGIRGESRQSFAGRRFGRDEAAPRGVRAARRRDHDRAGAAALRRRDAGRSGAATGRRRQRRARPRRIRSCPISCVGRAPDSSRRRGGSPTRSRWDRGSRCAGGDVATSRASTRRPARAPIALTRPICAPTRNGAGPTCWAGTTKRSTRRTPARRSAGPRSAWTSCLATRAARCCAVAPASSRSIVSPSTRSRRQSPCGLCRRISAPGSPVTSLRISAYRVPPVPMLSCGFGAQGFTCMWPFKRITDVKARLVSVDRSASERGRAGHSLLRRAR